MVNCGKLSIGMVVYDDFDGFYFTIQALRMYHSEAMKDVEFIVINTNPRSVLGEAVKSFCNSGHIKEPLHYYEDDNKMGTATRSKIFTYAKTPYVLVLDSHVLVESGGVKKLIEFFESGNDNGNLLQAPLLYDSLQSGPSKFTPQWSAGMLGTWTMDERSNGSEPFEIDGQGLGLFACRKNSWVGFAKNHSGFGSEECTVNDRFKSKGKKTLCLPWLKWLHRFARPNGVPYENKYEDRVKNYFRSYLELDKPVYEIIEHFQSLGVSESLMREWLDAVLEEKV